RQPVSKTIELRDRVYQREATAAQRSGHESYDAAEDEPEADGGESNHDHLPAVASHPRLEAFDRDRSPVGRDGEADQRQLEKNQHDCIRRDHRQDDAGGAEVLLADLTERSKVGRSRKTEQQADNVRRPRRAAAQSLLPLWRLLRFVGALLLAACARAVYPPA